MVDLHSRSTSELERFFFTRFIEHGIPVKDADYDAGAAARFATARVIRMPSEGNHISWSLIERYDAIERYPAWYQPALAREIGESLLILTSAFPGHVVNANRALPLSFYDGYGANAVHYAASFMRPDEGHMLRALSSRFPQRREALTRCFEQMRSDERTQRYMLRLDSQN